MDGKALSRHQLETHSLRKERLFPTKARIQSPFPGDSKTGVVSFLTCGGAQGAGEGGGSVLGEARAH